MFYLSSQERKIIIFIGALILLGMLLKVTNFPVPVEYKERTIAMKKINVNEASFEELVAIPYIGEKTARNIIRYVKEKGKIKDWKDLLEIKGIGEKKLELIKKYITF